MLITALRRVDIEDEVYQFGLPARSIPSASRILRAACSRRGRPAPRLADQRSRPAGRAVRSDRLQQQYDARRKPAVRHPRRGRTLTPSGCRRIRIWRWCSRRPGSAQICGHGPEIAETMVELFADLPPGHPFFEQFSFISAEEPARIPEHPAARGQAGRKRHRPRTTARGLWPCRSNISRLDTA